MKLSVARFLAEVRTRSRTSIPPELDPVGLIMSRVGVNPHSVESKALRKATLAVITTTGDLTEADLWALGQDALGLLDAFAQDRLSGRYRNEDLATVEKKLREA